MYLSHKTKKSLTPQMTLCFIWIRCPLTLTKTHPRGSLTWIYVFSGVIKGVVGCVVCGVDPSFGFTL